jgi:erythromycin esterase
MREYNQGEDRELHFYGFDLPLAGGSLASPRRVLAIVFDYLDRVGAATDLAERIAPLIEDDSKWERPAAWFEPDQSLGRSAEANELRLAIEDLVIELEIRGPELAGRGRREDYDEALHYARVGRLLMDAHAALATGGAYARMLGIRDLIMAENLLAAFARERRRGKVLAFAATGHLQRAMSEWSLPPEPGVKRWWPAGAQLARALGSRYAVIAQALGSSEANGLDRPELGTLESMLAGVGPAFFAPTRPGQAALEEQLEALPVRSGSTLNPTYSPLSPKSFAAVDRLLYLDTTAYPRGARPLSSWSA